MNTQQLDTPIQTKPINARLRDYGLLACAFACYCFVFSRIFPGWFWLLLAGIGLNGALCLAHGVNIVGKFRLPMGLFFSLLGAIQLGIVTMIISAEWR
jgi:hypothetical protein